MWGIKTPILFKNLKGKSLALFIPEGEAGYLITRSMVKRRKLYGCGEEFEPAMRSFENDVIGKEAAC